MVGTRYKVGASSDYTHRVSENENDSLYEFQADIKEMYINLIDSYLNNVVQVRLGAELGC